VKPKLWVGLLLAGACGAQNWELGGGMGYGVYHNGSIISSGGTADAGIRNRFVATGYAVEDLFQHFSGEVRYVYHDGDSFLSSGSIRGTVQAQSHTITYDAMYHFQPRGERIRVYVAGGVGAKFYDPTGPVPVPQPLPRIAGLTNLSQWKPAFDFGGGVRIRVKEHFSVRGDLRDYITSFPNMLFAPVANATERGIFHQVTPMFGIGANF
jgi:Outer membrane protein beta-barrel domain